VRPSFFATDAETSLTTAKFIPEQARVIEKPKIPPMSVRSPMPCAPSLSEIYALNATPIARRAIEEAESKRALKKYF
jgi:hypothetical protein